MHCKNKNKNVVIIDFFLNAAWNAEAAMKLKTKQLYIIYELNVFVRGLSQC